MTKEKLFTVTTAYTDIKDDNTVVNKRYGSLNAANVIAKFNELFLSDDKGDIAILTLLVNPYTSAVGPNK